MAKIIFAASQPTRPSADGASWCGLSSWNALRGSGLCSRSIACVCRLFDSDRSDIKKGPLPDNGLEVMYHDATLGERMLGEQPMTPRRTESPLSSSTSWTSWRRKSARPWRTSHRGSRPSAPSRWCATASARRPGEYAMHSCARQHDRAALGVGMVGGLLQDGREEFEGPPGTSSGRWGGLLSCVPSWRGSRRS
jgi:hypothetical protein